MNIKEVKELIEIIDNSNLTGFEYENSGVRLVLKKENNVVVPNLSGHHTTQNVVSASTDEKVEKVSKANDDLIEITSPIVGSFYAATSPESSPFVQIGDTVKKEQVLCIVEAMKLMNEITAEFDCEIVKILVKNEEMVQYGQPLFLVKAL